MSATLKEMRIATPLMSERSAIQAAVMLIPRFEAKIQAVLDRVWGKV